MESMLKELQSWPEKLQQGAAIAEQALAESPSLLPPAFTTLVIVGMGGSGVAGRLVKNLLEKTGTIHCIVVDGPELPVLDRNTTLAVAISYSGNTWETLEATNLLLRQKIPTIVVAHGGQLAEIANQYQLPLLQVPSCSAPRAALGYFLGMLLILLDRRGVLNGKKILLKWDALITGRLPEFQKKGFFEPFLTKVQGRDFFHIWGVRGDSSAAAYRAQTQFNENSKVAAVFSEIPELCHNLIVGVTHCAKSQFVLLFYSDFLPTRLTKGLEAAEELLQEYAVSYYKVSLKSVSWEEQLLDMVLWADFASYYLGLERDVDIEKVVAIERLKEMFKAKDST